MVIFQDFAEAEKASNTITELRKKLRAYPEFKFSKSKAEVKDVFFETICQFDFKVRALVVNKNTIYNTHLREKPESFYSYFVQMLMRYDGNLLNNATIKIDGSGDKGFRRALGVYLRQQVGQHKIKKLTFLDSEKDNLIQLADMVAGAIARSHNPDRDNSARWLQVLKKRGKIENIWDFK